MSTKVAVLGAAGGIGQPLSMLLKLCPLVDELACYDIVGTPGVAADLSHVRDVCFGRRQKKMGFVKEYSVFVKANRVINDARETCVGTSWSSLRD